MRFKFIVFVGILALVTLGLVNHDAEAQLRRRTSGRFAHAAQTPATTARTESYEMVTGQVIQLSPSLIPAGGPSGALGVGSIFYNDVDTSLNSGNLVVTGLPAGDYDAWLVFHDPFATKNIYSELVARFVVAENGARAETALNIGLPNVINMIHAKQLVVTHHVESTAQVGQEPISGAAGYKGGPGKGKAVLAGNIN